MIMLFDKDKIEKAVPRGLCLCIFAYQDSVRLICAEKLNPKERPVVDQIPDIFLQGRKKIVFDETFKYDRKFKMQYFLIHDKIRNDIVKAVSDNSRPISLWTDLLRVPVYIGLVVMCMNLSLSALGNISTRTSQTQQDPLRIIDTISDNTAMPLEPGEYTLTDLDVQNPGSRDITVDKVNGHMLLCNEGRFYLWCAKDECSIMTTGGATEYTFVKYRLQNKNEPKMYIENTKDKEETRWLRN